MVTEKGKYACLLSGKGPFRAVYFREYGKTPEVQNTLTGDLILFNYVGGSDGERGKVFLSRRMNSDISFFATPDGRIGTKKFDDDYRGVKINGDPVEGNPDKITLKEGSVIDVNGKRIEIFEIY